MARRRAAVIREVMPDAKYNDLLVARFVNYLMLDGKRAVVEKEVYKALEKLSDKLKRDSLEVFKEAVDKVTPRIEVRSRRIGGATYQIPTEVSERRGTALALKWITISIRKMSSSSLSDKIYKAIMEILSNSGWAYKKKEEVFRMAEANKAFAHYSW